jgi:hypothetical protein
MFPPSGFILHKRAFLPYTKMALYKVPHLNLVKFKQKKGEKKWRHPYGVYLDGTLKTIRCIRLVHTNFI